MDGRSLVILLILAFADHVDCLSSMNSTIVLPLYRIQECLPAAKLQSIRSSTCNCSRSPPVFNLCPPAPVPDIPRPSGQDVGDVQLVDGPRANVGRLEYYVNTTGNPLTPPGTAWHSVCDISNNFGFAEARVVCKQLGQPTDHATPISMQPFGPGDFGLTEIYGCTGGESEVDACSILSYAFSSPYWVCEREDEVGVNCIRDDDPLPQLALEDGTGDQSGRLLINIFGTWGTVCSKFPTYFGDDEAKVACRQMGLPHRNAKAATSFYRHDSQRYNFTIPVVYGYVSCNGDEERLDMCEHYEYPGDCDHSHDIGVICSNHESLEQDYIETYDGVLDAEKSGSRPPYFRIQEGAIVKFYCPLKDAAGLNTLQNNVHTNTFWELGNEIHKSNFINVQVQDRVQLYQDVGLGFNGRTAKRVSILTYTARREDNGKVLACKIEDLDFQDSVHVIYSTERTVKLVVLPGPTPQHFQSTVGDVWPGGFVGKIHIPIDDAYYTSWKMVLQFPKKVFRIYGSNFNVAPQPCMHKGACTKSFYTWVIWNTYENRVLSPLCELDLHFVASTSKKLGKGHGRGLVTDVTFYGFNKVFGSDYSVDVDFNQNFGHWPTHDEWFNDK